MREGGIRKEREERKGKKDKKRENVCMRKNSKGKGKKREEKLCEDDDAFITINSVLVPLIEGLCAQILYFIFEIIGGLRSYLLLFLFERKSMSKKKAVIPRSHSAS